MLSLIKKNVDESVGFIRTRMRIAQDADTDKRMTDTATGFRVGDCYMMTAYHVFQEKIG